MLSPVLITPPAVEAVTLDEAKLHLRVDGADEDTLITSLIAAAVGHLDGFTGILGRCLMAQTWSQEFEHASGDLVLPLGPVASVTSVTGGFTDYRILKDGRGHFLRLNDGAAWPSGPVVVEYVAGEDAVTPALKAALLLHIGTLYENRETLAEKVNPTRAYEALTAPYRTIGV
tara:strand:+ start:14738 stop:15256 length:519 start_codon:yes stop_codon:yes gene_type:complete